ncbi:MAG TPA: FAD-linked oxidase C-terminal domain-containing protein, partial [Blastocatellia bacterium]|nr:FAD-linked oxidase C-terminal domain-containing protein [Blastocatellia bacterium]
GLRMRVGRTSEDEIERIIRAGGRRGEIYARLKSLCDRYAGLIRERFPNIPRRASGYNLTELLPENGFHVARALVGSEGTCVTVLEATTRLIHSPPERVLLALGYKDVYTAGDHIMEIIESRPTGLEGMDDRLVFYMKKQGLHLREVAMLPEGGGWLLVEFGGDSPEEARERARKLMESLKKSADAPSMRLFENAREQERIWKVRESGLGATARTPGGKDTWEGWEDSAVPPKRLGDYLRDLRQLLNEYSLACSLYGHFGQGCVHTRIDFDLLTRKGIEKFRSFLYDAADLVLRYGGSFSGEHGDGQARGELLVKMFGPELIEAFREFKTIWDPDWKMNPGKVIDAYRADENLRLGVDYHPWVPKTHFSYPDDEGNFARAALRCVGVGECRRLAVSGVDSDTMCPSFMVTLEEKHSTRGRARLLFEMMQGEAIPARWRNEAVKEALDLCLACKGCKGDCPVRVDMATYKAEFLSHYYEGRLRPRTAYSMGLIHWWARLAGLAPGAANFFTRTPLIRDAVKMIGGIAPERRMPTFARQTFKQWFERRAAYRGQVTGDRLQASGGRRQEAEGMAYERFRNGQRTTDNGQPNGKPRVLLWPDTFNNYFHPETAMAAVEVLEAAGYRVELPQESLCCGRPLYDYGMLDLAKKLLRRILDHLRPQIAEGIPVVGLEPSCVAVFRDEMVNLLPYDADAARLREQTYLFSEFLDQQVGREKLPRLRRKALAHGHCHHKAVMRMDGETAILSALGLDYEVLPSGCCGMAGSFGFEKGEHYEVAMRVGERALLPAVREAEKDTLIIADGFSCREQIAQATDRRALHLAQVIQMAMREGPDAPAGDYPELAYIGQSDCKRPRSALRTAAMVGGGALACGALVWMVTRRK